MKIASSSGRPTDRSSCCCVPSPQSNRMTLAAGSQEQRGKPAARGRNRAGGTGEEQRDIHELRREVNGALRRPALRWVSSPGARGGTHDGGLDKQQDAVVDERDSGGADGDRERLGHPTRTSTAL